jgi:hypothetical protein
VAKRCELLWRLCRRPIGIGDVTGIGRNRDQRATAQRITRRKFRRQHTAQRPAEQRRFFGYIRRQLLQQHIEVVTRGSVSVQTKSRQIEQRDIRAPP